MTTALVAPPIAWELHRPRRGPAVATAYLEQQECARLTGPLLHLRIALADRRLTRMVTAAYSRRAR